MCKELDVPFFTADATAYTKEGYVGKSVYSMLNGLVAAANGDIVKAQNGILVIDEIDKKLSRDISGTDVLYSLLKIMDREVIEVEGDFYDSFMFDTSNLTIVFLGAFMEMYDNKKTKKYIGFGNNSNEKLKNDVITEEDFIKFGMPSEFIGRIGTIAYTNEFNLNDLIRILFNSKISPLKIEKEYFESLGIKFTYTSPYVWEIARKSFKSKTGARDLKKLVKNSLRYANEDVLKRDKTKVLRLTKDTALDNKKYYIE